MPTWVTTNRQVMLFPDHRGQSRSIAKSIRATARTDGWLGVPNLRKILFEALVKKRNRQQQHQLAKGERYALIPGRVLESVAYKSLSARGHLLLSNLLSQFSGRNNGDLSATYSEMKKRGFGSKATLSRALKELLIKGLILLTRSGSYGSIRQCNLYAIGWLDIPEMSKLDIRTPIDARNGWKTWEPKPPNRRVDSLDTGTPFVGKTGPTGGTKQVHTGETIPP